MLGHRTRVPVVNRPKVEQVTDHPPPLRPVTMIALATTAISSGSYKHSRAGVAVVHKSPCWAAGAFIHLPVYFID